MTINYELTKSYNRRKPIQVTANSLKSFLEGKSETLEHIVLYEFRNQIVIRKPPYKWYGNYIMIYGY